MKKQVLQLCHDYHGPFVSVCRQYVEALPDAEVTTIFVSGKSDQTVATGVGGHKVLFMEGDNLRGIKFSQIFKLKRLLGPQQFDAVVAHRYKAIYLAGMMSYFQRFPRLLGVAHEHKVFRRITRKLFVTFWRPNFIVAGVSNSVVADIDHYCPSLSREGRLQILPNVLPNGFEEGLLSREDARRALELNENDFIVGMTGRLVKKKSIDVLLEAFAQLKDSTTQLVLIGDGPLRSQLEAQATSLGLADRVRFLGHIQDAGRYVRCFDIFVLPSGQAEAFGLVLLEAMLAGVPVLSSSAPGPAEVVGNPASQFTEANSADLAQKISEFQNLPANDLKLMTETNIERVRSEYSSVSFSAKLSALLSI